MQPGRYPRILPAAPTSSKSGSSGGSRKKTKAPPPSLPRPGACVGCRARKTKCDGGRPACTNCMKRGQTECVYPERLITGQRAIEFVELLKSLSPERSVALAKRLRERGDLTAVIAEFRSGTVDTENDSLSGFDSWGTRQPRLSLEGELMAHNPSAFPILTPIDAEALAKSHLLHPEPPASSDPHMPETPAAPVTSPPGYLETLRQPVEYCDERLQHLQASFWTDIDVSNDFTARVISLYITTDHPLLGLFDPDLFITDLVSQQTNYCSRFLFHALMYLGCMYSAFDKNATQRANAFRQNAQSLCEVGEDSYLSMAGAVLLSISLMGSGQDHSVLRYATDAMHMGVRLGLFGTRDAHQPNVDVADSDWSAKCHAAWGVFNWNVMISTFYRQPGSESPASTPTVPVPGEPPGEVHYAGVYAALEAEVGEDGNPSEEAIIRAIFPVLCDFWRLVHAVRWIYYSGEGNPPLHLRPTLVEYAYRELIAWIEIIPPILHRRDRNPHYVTVFHIWLHTAILDMWQPFVYKTTPEDPQLKTFTSLDRSINAAYTASVNQLKHLIVEYRSQHAASTYSILWHNGLIYLVNAILRSNDPDWRLYLLLCIYGYERLSRSFRIAEVITQGLLAMTMRDTNLSGTEAHKIMEEIMQRGFEHLRKDLHHDVHATFMIDLRLALTNPEAAKAENMADEFTDLATFQDLIDFNTMDVDDDTS